MSDEKQDPHAKVTEFNDMIRRNRGDAWAEGYQAGSRAASSGVGTFHLNPYRNVPTAREELR